MRRVQVKRYYPGTNTAHSRRPDSPAPMYGCLCFCVSIILAGVIDHCETSGYPFGAGCAVKRGGFGSATAFGES